MVFYVEGVDFEIGISAVRLVRIRATSFVELEETVKRVWPC